MSVRHSLCAVAAILLLVVEALLSPMAVVGESVRVEFCEVCSDELTDHQPHMNIKVFENNTICLTNTFVYDGPDRLDCSRAEKAEKVEIPSCRICYNPADAVESIQRVWFDTNGTKCARAGLVRKNWFYILSALAKE